MKMKKILSACAALLLAGTMFAAMGMDSDDENLSSPTAASTAIPEIELTDQQADDILECMKNIPGKKEKYEEVGAILARFFLENRTLLFLTELELTTTDFTQAIVPFLEKYPEIRYVSFLDNQIQLQEPLEFKLSLIDLSLQRNGLTENTVGWLAKLDVKNLNVSENPIGDKGFNIIVQNKHLLRLRANMCNLTFQSLNYANEIKDKEIYMEYQ